MFDIVVEAIFLSALFLNAFLAFKSGDQRLKSVAGLFLAIWLVTHCFPYSELLVSLVSFVVLSRIQIRRSEEKELARWMVPVIVAEAGIFLSHLAFPTLGYISYWALVQFLFAAQLCVTISTGAKIALRRELRSSEKKRGWNSSVSIESTGANL